MGSWHTPVIGNLQEEEKLAKETEKEWQVGLKENQENAVPRSHGQERLRKVLVQSFG